MKHWKQFISVMLMALPVMFTSSAQADGKYNNYAVTITNITHGEIFTPVLVATHNDDVRLFELGAAASTELEMLAEGGDTVPLADSLKAQGAYDVADSGAVLPPGESVTVYVKTNRRNAHVSVAAMLVPSNDAFLAVNGVKGPRHSRSKRVLSPAYDAGTESNDELCVSIPGPPFICAGEGFNANGGEGYVYIHPGIHGIGDLVAASHDWRNPVAKITIQRVRHID